MSVASTWAAPILGPWTAWDLRGEPYKGGEFQYLGRTIYLSQLPEGVFLARFVELSQGALHRFLGETAELAMQHAVDYIKDFLVSAERRALELADSDSTARSLLARLNRELLEKKRAGATR